MAVPTVLANAMAQVESGNNKWLNRYEPHYKYLWDVRTNNPLRDYQGFNPERMPSLIYSSPWTEYINQKTSWGVWQVMGAVAREYAYRKPLPCLIDECEDIYSRHMATMARRFRLDLQNPKDWWAICTAYNTGSPKSGDHPYWAKVRRTLTSLGYKFPE